MSLNIDINQRRRKQKRMKNKKARSIKNIVLGIFVVITFSFILNSLYNQDNNANADTANILGKEDSLYLEKPKAVKLNTSTEEKYFDKLQAYKKVNTTSWIYSDENVNSKQLLEVRPGYIQYFGYKGNWAKVQHKNIIGYIRKENLSEVKSNQLKVIESTLVVTKDFIIPEDFETDFSQEAESAVLVMLEAMKRDGHKIKVGSSYLPSSSPEFSNISFGEPNSVNSELRTGFAVEFKLKEEDSDLTFGSTEASKWLEKNAHKYGFIQRYPEGKESVTGFNANPKIYRYVGLQLSKKLYDNDLTIEEYFN